jgi:hypothetical protein
VSEEATASFLLGAGFSAAFGIPTMKPFYDKFIDFARRQYENLVPTLDDLTSDLGNDADLESLLSKLNAAVTVDAGLPSSFDRGELEEWIKLARTLRSHLLSYIVEICEQFDREKAVLLCGNLMRGASETGVTIFTTNYDRVVEHVCSVAGIRVADGFAQEPGELVNPWNAQFQNGLPLAKLHGSVTWYVDQADGPTFLRLDRGYPLPGPDFHLSRSGRDLEPLMIVPTLEKQALGPPYNHLLNFLTDTLSRTKVLVVMGTSLRDEHIVGAIRYHANDLCVLLIGSRAEELISRLPGMAVEALSVTTEEVLTVSAEALGDLVGEAVKLDQLEKRSELLHGFVERERQRIAEWRGLTDDQRNAVRELESGDMVRQLAALEVLRGLAHPQVMRATLPMLGADGPELRSSAAGSLGLARDESAIEQLEHLAIQDPDRLVRLEAALALKRIASARANQALNLLKEARPDEAEAIDL